MPWNSLNSLKTKAKKAGGGITMSFDSMSGVTLHTGTPGWKVYTISSTSAMTRTITATVSSDTSINIIVCGGGGGSIGYFNGSAGGSGGSRFREIQKFISATNPTQIFTCTIPASAFRSSGGTSSITFSVPTVGDISCGGGGAGGYIGDNAPPNGGSGGGGGSAYNYSSYTPINNPGGTGVTSGGGGFNTGYSSSSGTSYNGGGGGAGGSGASATSSGNGAGGLGISATLAGITAVYNNTYKFCSGGHGNPASSPESTFGSGSTGILTGSGSKTGNAGAIIIAVPA
jgi:hypothetical protein